MTAHVPGRAALIEDFVRLRYTETGVPPSAREVSAGVGLASTGTVHYHLGQLVRDGKLRKVRRQYVPVNAVASPVGIGHASCPWESLAHDFVLVIGEPYVFCRKCGVTRRLELAS